MHAVADVIGLRLAHRLNHARSLHSLAIESRDENRTVIIRPEPVDDHEAIRRVVADAFGSDRKAQLVDRIRASPEYVDEIALVAETHSEVVGYVMISIEHANMGASG